jgi:hypothetical protein
VGGEAVAHACLTTKISSVFPLMIECEKNLRLVVTMKCFDIFHENYTTYEDFFLYQKLNDLFLSCLNRKLSVFSSILGMLQYKYKDFSAFTVLALGGAARVRGRHWSARQKNGNSIKAFHSLARATSLQIFYSTLIISLIHKF